MKTKRIGLSLAAAAIALASSAQEAKYIFYFIGDGMLFAGRIMGAS